MTKKTPGRYLIIAIFLLVVAYFGAQVWMYYHNPFSVTPTFTYSMDDTLDVRGYLVRHEEVLPSQSSGELRLLCDEGERVSDGGAVAQVYDSIQSIETYQQLEEAEDYLQQMEFAQEALVSGRVTLSLDDDIASELLALHQDLGQNNLAHMDGHIAQVREMVIKRDYTYQDPQQVQADLAQAQAQVDALRRQVGSSRKTIYADSSGLYSAMVDGYEQVLTPSAVQSMTPSDFNALTPDTTVSSNVGKLVLDERWHYVTVVDEATALMLELEGEVDLRFSQGLEQHLSMDVTSVSAPENGECVVVLSSREYISELTLLRNQSAQLILESATGIYIPRTALRVNDQGQTGVYCVLGVAARFKPVDVVFEDDNMILVQPTQEALGVRRLLGGDIVIVSARDLYDGKVVR